MFVFLPKQIFIELNIENNAIISMQTLFRVYFYQELYLASSSVFNRVNFNQE